MHDAVATQPLEQQLRMVQETLLWKANELYETDTVIAAKDQDLQALRARRAQVAAETEALERQRAELAQTLRQIAAPNDRGRARQLGSDPHGAPEAPRGTR